MQNGDTVYLNNLTILQLQCICVLNAEWHSLCALYHPLLVTGFR